jgi:hypothetical protein
LEAANMALLLLASHLVFAGPAPSAGPAARGVAVSPACAAEFARLCANSATCRVCAGKHQSSLRDAGCSAADVEALCAAPPSDGLERGIIYVQPSYHFSNTLDLDLAVLRTDLDTIKATGIVNVGLRTSWGEIMAKWDGEARTATWNEDKCAKLAAIATECGKRDLRLIFNTHLRDTVPEGVEGAHLVNHTAPDASGVVPAPYWTSTFVDHMVRDSYREPIVKFHAKFAKCLKQSPNVPRFWKHSFESACECNNAVFPQSKSQ